MNLGETHLVYFDISQDLVFYRFHQIFFSVAGDPKPYKWVSTNENCDVKNCVKISLLWAD